MYLWLSFKKKKKRDISIYGIRGYFYLITTGIPLPSFYDSKSKDGPTEKKKKRQKEKDKHLILFVVSYFVVLFSTCFSFLLPLFCFFYLFWMERSSNWHNSTLFSTIPCWFAQLKELFLCPGGPVSRCRTFRVYLFTCWGVNSVLSWWESQQQNLANIHVTQPLDLLLNMHMQLFPLPNELICLEQIHFSDY